MDPTAFLTKALIGCLADCIGLGTINYKFELYCIYIYYITIYIVVAVVSPGNTPICCILSSWSAAAPFRVTPPPEPFFTDRRSVG